MILFQIDKNLVFLELIEDSVYSFYVWLAWILNIDQNVVSIYDNKNIKFFSKNLVDIVLKTGWSMGKAKRHNLILEIVIPSLKSSLLLISFSNFYLVVNTG